MRWKGLVRGELRADMGSLGPSLTDQQQADALQQIGRQVHSLREKNIGTSVSLVDFDRS